MCCRYTPDVVFLQELIPPYVQYLKKRAVSYLIIEGVSFTFFDLNMVKCIMSLSVSVIYVLQVQVLFMLNCYLKPSL